MKNAGIFFILMMFGFGSSGHAFEVDRFRSGISVKEAILIADNFDLNVKVQDPSDLGRYMFIRPGGDQENSIKWDLLFCNDRLVQLSRDYPFSWSAAEAVVSRLNQHYGEGSVRPKKSEAFQSKNGKLASSLSSTVGFEFSWENDEEWVSVIIKFIDHERQEKIMFEEQIKEAKIVEIYALHNERCIYGLVR